GKDRLTWLHALTTQHLEQLPVATWIDALILDPQGHVIEQLFLVDDGQTTWIHLEKERTQGVVDYLNKMKFMLEVDVTDQSNNFAVFRAPGLADKFGGPYALVPRSELKETTEAFNKSHTQVGIWALEAERVAAGRARLLFETDHKSIPNELGFLNNAVHMNKGCYRGQETVAKVFNLGQPPRRLVLLHLDGSMVAMPEHGAKLFFEGKEVGYICTMARHFELGPIALAVIKRNTPDTAELVSESVSANIFMEIK
ncbi:MAG: folate-binding protein, partial [Actinobacteria bacterium]|nr:folate-binding protein [Actinomycetota bacterium]